MNYKKYIALVSAANAIFGEIDVESDAAQNLAHAITISENEITEVTRCRYCREVEVKDYGDLCPECQMSAAEAKEER